MLQRRLHIPRQIFHSQVAHRNAKVISCHVFQFMGFVENHRGSFRENPRVRRTVGLQFDGEVGEEQMMVHDDDVALQRPPVHLGDEAALPLAALLPDAGFRTCVQLVPEQADLGKLSQFGAIAGLCRLLPRGNRAILLNLIQPAQHRLIGEVVQFLAAQIIVAALHVADREPPWSLTRLHGRRICADMTRKQSLLQERNIFIKKLLLKILRTGRDDDALARTNHRQKVSQCLPRARARLDDEVALFFQRLLHCLRHLQLSTAKFIRRMRTGQHSSGREELVERCILSARSEPA